MTYFVRPMELRDIPQVADIERESFPPPWPATNFKKELTSNTLARYLVAYMPELQDDKALSSEIEALDISDSLFRLKLGSLKSSIGRMVGREEQIANERQVIMGFIGLWFMVDEAHISNFAVGETYRKQGIGEHLLICAIDVAVDHSARFITLEVRASNRAAIALYRKYNFLEVGIRRGYYTDNKEDAVLMTAEGITSARYREVLQRLKQSYAQQRGISA
jgi:ribosomal-protein-alanine N-acetyltransferase